MLQITIFTRTHHQILNEVRRLQNYKKITRHEHKPHTALAHILNFNGKEVTGFDICSVRFSKKHPSEWGKAFGIDKYLWFELIPDVKKE